MSYDIKTPDFKIGDKVIVESPASTFYKQTAVITSVGTILSRIRIDVSQQEISMPTEWLDYTIEQKIKMLCPDDRKLIEQIIPGKWVAYDDNGMYFSAFSSDATPVFNTKSELIGELSATYLDGRKRKTIQRKTPGLYWYTFPDCDNKRTKRCFVIEQVTSENLNKVLAYCLAGLCPPDYK